MLARCSGSLGNILSAGRYNSDIKKTLDHLSHSDSVSNSSYFDSSEFTNFKPGRTLTFLKQFFPLSVAISQLCLCSLTTGSFYLFSPEIDIFLFFLTQSFLR